MEHTDDDATTGGQEEARQQGRGEVEINRHGNHTWRAPLFTRTFEGTGRTATKCDVREAVADALRRETDPGPPS
ncbi:hypothetical protein FH965_29365 [Streptomyces spectabilis]|uniref:Uncharacterized protein n=1 Tax=Streptomyces spectabilis TaxID=68270 RepID=A0A516RLT6_STRST|nr:hypothetical protein FH965_29365 [Streptomyces spectabilis]